VHNKDFDDGHLYLKILISMIIHIIKDLHQEHSSVDNTK